ncbi:helix-turn-helix domain-containing protein [Streptomyces sp. NPDC059460]|uniref:helix-turn-helix domain-containing protein n=1 Tax=Streptomyces sp. NPDC059460 TaxID=3346840 RepID=UPI0036BE4EDA
MPGRPGGPRVLRPRPVLTRSQAAERFARGEASALIAKALRVSVRSVQRWRRTWNEGGPRALRSQGPTSQPRWAPRGCTGPAAGEDQSWPHLTPVLSAKTIGWELISPRSS